MAPQESPQKLASSARIFGVDPNLHISSRVLERKWREVGAERSEVNVRALSVEMLEVVGDGILSPQDAIAHGTRLWLEGYRCGSKGLKPPG